MLKEGTPVLYTHWTGELEVGLIVKVSTPKKDELSEITIWSNRERQDEDMRTMPWNRVNQTSPDELEKLAKKLRELLQIYEKKKTEIASLKL